MDLLDDEGPDTGSNAPEFSVSEISGAVKRTLESTFGRVRVRGEVGRVFRARSGHLYFDVKDDRAVLGAVCWKGQISGLAVVPEEGMEVIATGRLSTFPGQSKYQLTVDDVEPAGVGALMAMLEKRKKVLEAEGLFAAERKRPLPYLPEVIGVVTSPGGAVIRDILHRLSDRFPRHVLVWPVAVQGRDCAPQVAAAIRGFNALPARGIPRPDVLIVARGGGSIEDLWGFNEEIVARAVAGSELPLISAVGHETDTTLIDYVSDRRAPTPTAAAEMAVPVRRDLVAELGNRGARLTTAMARGMARREERLRDLGRALPRAEGLTAAARQRLDYASARLPEALRTTVAQRRVVLAERSAVLRPGTLAARIREAHGQADRLAGQLEPALRRALKDRKRHLIDWGTRLAPVLITRATARQGESLTALERRLDQAAGRRMERWRGRLEAATRLLGSLGYEETLRRGFAVVRTQDGTVVTTKATADRAQALEIQFLDGRLKVGGAGASAKKPSKAKTPPPEQGQLF